MSVSYPPRELPLDLVVKVGDWKEVRKEWGVDLTMVAVDGTCGWAREELFTSGGFTWLGGRGGG